MSGVKRFVVLDDRHKTTGLEGSVGVIDGYVQSSFDRRTKKHLPAI